MPVTLRHEAAVRASLADIVARASDVAVQFHGNLISGDSEIVALLAGADPEAFRCEAAQMLAAIVEAAEEPEQLVALCAALGRRIGGLGLREQHYARAAGALVDAVRATLGVAFDPDLEGVCRTVIGVVQAVVQRVTTPPA